MPKATIAVIEGRVGGGGSELALSCDMRFAGPTAVFNQPEVALGIIPGGTGTVRLPRLVGRSRALEAILGAARSITNAYGQTIRVTIPAGTQPGERLRLRGQGVVTDKRVGDLFVEVNVMVPRELSEALKRRCLYLHVDYPELEREKQIVTTKVEGISDNLAEQVARVVRSLRQLDLKKSPSVSETIDWARTLLALGASDLTPEVVRDNLGVLLKHRDDIERAAASLVVG